MIQNSDFATYFVVHKSKVGSWSHSFVGNCVSVIYSTILKLYIDISWLEGIKWSFSSKKKLKIN